MTLYEYNLLNETDRANYTWDKGIFLTHMTCGEVSITLYSVDDFFVEVWMEDNTIRKFQSFKSVRALERYLHQISIKKVKELL
jgi:hypothetical protein